MLKYYFHLWSINRWMLVVWFFKILFLHVCYIWNRSLSVSEILLCFTPPTFFSITFSEIKKKVNLYVLANKMLNFSKHYKHSFWHLYDMVAMNKRQWSLIVIKSAIIFLSTWSSDIISLPARLKNSVLLIIELLHIQSGRVISWISGITTNVRKCTRVKMQQ